LVEVEDRGDTLSDIEDKFLLFELTGKLLIVFGILYGNCGLCTDGGEEI
jgi:hypothetical protein